MLCCVEVQAAMSGRGTSADGNTGTKVDTKLNARRRNASVRPDSDDRTHPGLLANSYPLQDRMILPVRRRSLSPTRRLALERLEAQEQPGSRIYRAIKSLESSMQTAGSETVVREARSVLDIGRLRRCADKRRDEVALHLVSHDPTSAVFRAALTTPLGGRDVRGDGIPAGNGNPVMGM